MKFIKIENFKCIRELPIQLNKINIVVGSPNTGKSTLLEALALASLCKTDFFDWKEDNILDYLYREHSITPLVNQNLLDREVESKKAKIKSDQDEIIITEYPHPDIRFVVHHQQTDYCLLKESRKARDACFTCLIRKNNSTGELTPIFFNDPPIKSSKVIFDFGLIETVKTYKLGLSYGLASFAVRFATPQVIKRLKERHKQIVSDILLDTTNIIGTGQNTLTFIQKALFIAVTDTEGGLMLIDDFDIHPIYIKPLTQMILDSSAQFVIVTHNIDFIETLFGLANEQSALDTINIIRMHRRKDNDDIFVEILNGKEAFEEMKTIGTDFRIT